MGLLPAHARPSEPVVEGAALDVEIGGLQAANARGLHVRPRLGQRAADVDPAAGVLDDRRAEARLPRVDRRPSDAEVGGEPAQIDLGEAAVTQIAGEPGRRLAVRLVAVSYTHLRAHE